MNLTFLYFVAGILGLVCTVGLGFFIYDRFREEEDPEDGREIENYLIQYSGGNSEGIIDKIELGNERIKIDAFYFDKKKLQKDRKYKLQKYTIFYEKRQVVPLFFGNETKIKSFPHRIDLLPNELLNTDYGKEIAKIITTNNEMKDESELMIMRLDNLQKVAKKTVGGEIFMDFVKKSQEINKEIREGTTKDEAKKFENK